MPAESSISPDGGIPSPGGAKTWDDNYSESTFDPGGSKQGNQWEDWGKVMDKAVAPPMGCLEDVLRRTPLSDPLDQAEVNVLWPLMIEEISCPAGHYALELRFLQSEVRIITEVIQNTTEIGDDEVFNLDPSEWAEFGPAFYNLPQTRRECSERTEKVQGRIRDLHGLIDAAKRKGVFYDVCGLIDWFATPPGMRNTDSPSHTLAHFGRLLFGILGIAANNTQWAHIEAVTSRQIAPRFGGDYMENQKTKHQNPVPSMGAGAPASNAPR